MRGSSILFSGAKRRFWHPKSVIYEGWGAEYGGLHPETVIERGVGCKRIFAPSVVENRSIKDHMGGIDMYWKIFIIFGIGH